MLAQADYVVVILSLTPETRHMIGRAEFGAMKHTAYFINIGRGPVVDETALVEALQARTIAGAGLDTMEVEPLPPDSPLWEMEQVIITPHVGGAYPTYEQDMVAIYCENLRRFLAGEPADACYR